MSLSFFEFLDGWSVLSQEYRRENQRRERVQIALTEFRNELWHALRPVATKLQLTMGPMRVVAKTTLFDVRAPSTIINAVSLRNAGKRWAAHHSFRALVTDESLAEFLDREGSAICNSMAIIMREQAIVGRTHPSQTVVCIAVLWDGADTGTAVALLVAPDDVPRDEDDLSPDFAMDRVLPPQRKRRRVAVKEPLARTAKKQKRESKK